MGSTFELIADSALQPEDPEYYRECHVCGKCDLPLYRCQGEAIRVDGTLDAEDVYVACTTCLKAKRVAHLGEYLTDELIERFGANPDEMKSLLRQTPRIPLFMQGDDWPICCGRLTEFTGAPASTEELIAGQERSSYWDRGVAESSYTARRDGPPESLREISFFRCQSCELTYWIFQPT